jgi:hypothetical protein
MVLLLTLHIIENQTQKNDETIPCAYIGFVVGLQFSYWTKHQRFHFVVERDERSAGEGFPKNSQR